MSQEDWTHDIEAIASHWRRQSLARKRVHEMAASRYGCLHKSLTLPQIIISAVLGTLSFNEIREDSSSVTVSVIITLLSSSLAVLTTLNAFLKLERNRQMHTAVSKQYGRLAYDIDATLARRRGSRARVDVFLEKTKTTMTSLMDQAPTVPTGLLAKFPLLMDEGADYRPHIHSDTGSPSAAASTSEDLSPREFFYCAQAPIQILTTALRTPLHVHTEEIESSEEEKERDGEGVEVTL